MLAVVLAILPKLVVILEYRIEEYIKMDSKSRIFKANSKFDLKIKEALHINWRKPNLNAQQSHLSLTFSL